GAETLPTRELGLQRPRARPPGPSPVARGGEDRAVANGPRVVVVGGVETKQVEILRAAITIFEDGMRLLFLPALAAVPGVQDHAILASDPPVLGVGEADRVEGGIDPAREAFPALTAVRGLQDLAGVSHHDGAVGRQGLDVVEAVGRIDGALEQGQHLDFSVAAERERQEQEAPRDGPATHDAPPPGPRIYGPEAGVTDLLFRCQWDGGTAVPPLASPFLPSGNHFGTSAGSTINCWSTFQTPSSF